MTNFKLQNYKFEFLTPQTYTMSQIKNPLLQGKRKNKLEKHERKMSMMTYCKNIPLIGIKKMTNNY